jgi:hypothetical protein
VGRDKLLTCILLMCERRLYLKGLNLFSSNAASNNVARGTRSTSVLALIAAERVVIRGCSECDHARSTRRYLAEQLSQACACLPSQISSFRTSRQRTTMAQDAGRRLGDMTPQKILHVGLEAVSSALHADETQVL